MTETTVVPVRRLEGEQIRGWLEAQRAAARPVRSFRYRANRPGLWSLAGIGVCLLLAIGTYVARTPSPSTAQVVILSLGAIFALICLLTVVRWGMFTVLRYVLLTEEEMVVGAGRRAIVIPSSRLSQSTIGAKEMRRGARIGLPIQIDGVRADVHLVGAFAVLNDLNQFVAEILGRVAQNDGIELKSTEGDDELPEGGNAVEPT